jgi:hypothetical protein
VHPCVGVARSVGRRGLLAHQRAHLDGVLPIAWCQSIKRGSALDAPPCRLAVGRGGVPYLVEMQQSAP